MTLGVVSGDESFHFEYLFRNEPDYLVEMARVTGAGTCRLQAFVEAQNTLWLLLEPEIEGRADVDRAYDILTTRIEAADSAGRWNSLWQLPELARKDLAELTDDRGVVEAIIEARAIWRVPRDSWRALLDYVNGFVDQPLTLADFDDPMSEALIDADEQLAGGAGDYLPLLALSVLEHAVVNQIDPFEVWEVEPFSRDRVRFQLSEWVTES